MLEDLPDMPGAMPAKRSPLKKRPKNVRFDALGAPVEEPSPQQSAKPVKPTKPAAKSEEPKPVRTVKTRKLPGNVLAVGETVHIGAEMPPPPDDPSERNHCVDKNGGDTVFCIEPVDWPPQLRSKLRVSSIMYQGAQAVIRYDNGKATRIQAIYPNDSFDALVSYFSGRFGKSTEVGGNTIAPFAQPRQENPTVQWQRKDPLSDKLTTLEVRKYDDSRGGFPDLRHGTIMLYASDSPSIFPELSALDLMPTTGSN